MGERKKMSDGWFLLIWGYLMVLSIVLSPVIAAVVKQEIAKEARR
jgi:hypothetical protein